MTHVHRVVIAPGLYCTIQSIMLQTRQYIMSTSKVALITTNHCCSNKTTKIWVFSTSFYNTPPTSIPSDINHWAIRPTNTIAGAFLCCYTCCIFYLFNVPTTRLCQRNREYGPIPMYHIQAHQQRNTQTAFFYCNLLNCTNLVFST